MTAVTSWGIHKIMMGIVAPSTSLLLCNEMLCSAFYHSLQKYSDLFLANSPNTLIHLNLHGLGDQEVEILAIIVGESLPKTMKCLGVCFVLVGFFSSGQHIVLREIY